MNVLAPAIPVLTFLIWWGVFHETQGDWRSAFVSGSILWAAFLVAVTEVLSLIKAIAFVTVLAAWSLFLSIALLWWARRRGTLQRLWRGMDLFRVSRAERLLLLGGILVTLTVGIVAWIAPPNTWDAMTYHMPRVMHWIQDQSVDAYPTQDIRQLYINPGSEFIVLHLQILSGSDRLANLAQWFSMIGSALGASLIARALGAGQRVQVFSAITSLTIPMGILQASSTQTDYVTAYWLVCFVYWGLLLMARPGFWRAAALGASLGLAALSKSTTYIYTLPLLLGGGLWFLATYRWRAILVAGIAAFFLVGINLGYYVRNYELLGNPLAISQDNPHHFANDIFSVPEFESNVVRNVALHLGTPFDPVNSYLQKGVRWVHREIGISESDPRTTWPGTSFAQAIGIQLHEDHDGNLLHLILILCSFLVLLRRPLVERRLLAYSLCLLMGFLVFCLYLKWQPWNSRLHLPLFVMAAPLIGVAADRIQPRWIGPITMVALLLGALPWVFLNRSRPLIGEQSILFSDRTSLYFRNRTDLAGPYAEASKFVSKFSRRPCTQVALHLVENNWEYPFWVLLQQDLGKDVRLESVDVGNVSQNTSSEFPQFAPCAVLAVGNKPIESLVIQARVYATVQRFGVVSVLSPR